MTLPGPVPILPNCLYCGRRFHRRGLHSHEWTCRDRVDDARFVILAVQGAMIGPEAAGHGGAAALKPHSDSFFVLDTHDMDREWATFHGGYPHHLSEAAARRKAVAECQRLNRLHAQGEL